MLDIEEINKRLNGARHYVTCPKARNECKQCDDWFYSATNVQSIIRSFVTDIDSLMNSRDDIIRELGIERNALQNKLGEARDECRQHLARINQLESADVERIAALTNQCEELKVIRDRILSDRDKAREQLGLRHGALTDCVRDVRKALGLQDSINVIDGAKLIIEARDNARAQVKQLDSMRIESERILDEAGKVLNESNAPAGLLVDRIEWLAVRNALPIPMILHCPSCNARHIDAGEFATKSHHTHACQSCGAVWRPAIAATVGVQFLPGFKDEPSGNDSCDGTALPSRDGIRQMVNRHAGSFCGNLLASLSARGLLADDTTLPADESVGQDVAKVEYKAEDATSTNVVPDDVLQRATVWANKKIGLVPLPSDVHEARNVVNNVSHVAPSWQNEVREFVKLWREGQAPDRPHPDLP